MAGHSKFANIKRKKEKNDAQRGRTFTRLGRELAVAVKFGGPDVALNAKLREIVSKAKANNMPNDTIERSIKKAAGDLGAVNYETVTYEGYGPNGVAIIVDVLTDNRNRSAANVRNAFTKGGGNMGTTGCVSFMFDTKGQILVENTEHIDEDELMMIALESGASDFISNAEYFEILTEENNFLEVSEALERSNIKFISAEVIKIPQTYTKLTDEDDIKKMTKLLDLLDEEDDVQNVYHNLEE